MRNKRFTRGFTLVEVIVSMAILAMGLTTLLIIRNASLQQAAESIDTRRLNLLLRQKMGLIVAGVEKSSRGSFKGEDYKDYRWEVNIQNFDVSCQDEEGKVYTIKMKKVKLTVRNAAKPKQYKVMVNYVFKENPEDAKNDKK